MGSLIFTQWYYHSQCFKAVSPASQCHQRFLTAGSPGPSSNETDWCLIRKTGCTVPEDITETGMLMGCLLIVALIKFREFKRRLLFGPQLLIEGSSPETHKWELNDWWTARKMTYVLFIFNLSLYRSYQYFSFTNLNIFLQIVFGIPKRITEKSPKNRYLFSFIIDFDLVLLNSKAPLSLDIRQQNKPCQSSDEPISIQLGSVYMQSGSEAKSTQSCSNRGKRVFSALFRQENMSVDWFRQNNTNDATIC